MQMTYVPSDITIIITCYKEGELLRRAMASVHAQTVKGFAVILVNDCSPDTLTNAICDELAAASGLLYLRLEQNGGSALARNAAIAKCSTPLIIPLDGDDTLPAHIVATALQAFNTTPDIDFLFGDYEVKVPETGTLSVVSCAILTTDNGMLSGAALAHNWCLLGQLPYKRKVWEAVGGFNKDYSHTYEDVVFWRDAIMAGMQGQYVPQVLYCWHRSENGKNASLDEEHFLDVRIESLEFYDRYYLEYGREMRQYIYRYYASRLMAEKLNAFLQLPHGEYFTAMHRIKAKLMYVRPLYVALRHLHNLVRPTQ